MAPEAVGPSPTRWVFPGAGFFTDLAVTGTVRGTEATSTRDLVAVIASRAPERLLVAAGELLPRVRDRVPRAEVEAWLELRTRLL
ncbi:hypothetical protein ACFQ6C_06680 [Streptomyces sp. NPDC056454]|uniref:hypothetical protein n=1 Tax=Streptomyces sp. NPDC056454 TaxID=3345823 RepID=UPI0036BB3BF7